MAIVLRTWRVIYLWFTGNNSFQPVMLAIIIFAVTKAVVVVPASWITGGKLLKWPQCSAHQCTQYRVKETKCDGPYQEHTVHIYGIFGRRKPRRLTESTTEVSATDDSTSSDTPPEGNGAALAGYHIIDVDLSPNHQLINTRSPVISPRLIQPIGLRPHSVLTEQRLFSLLIPSSPFLQPITSTFAYTPPALCNDPYHQQLLPSIKEELGRMSELLQCIARRVTQLSSSSQSYMPQHIKVSAAEKGSQAVSLLSAVKTDADFEVPEDFLSENSNVKCFVCVRQCLQSDLFLSGAVHEPAWQNVRGGIVAQHSFA
ncbi:hypothetical protein EG68_09247 [Paragonimus skrjabini miyazakii]|uniref:Uncharacterized protein n=1 Tax=Paragonimus skrjabini miyazakii TaxID=59628 RepID=A0A8S9YP33_9TREM|nr:hypothetical protein EG68_09247 [Paragonimus skrjabini miyazakii]